MRTHVALLILICYFSNFCFTRSSLPDKRKELQKRINRMLNGTQGGEMFLNIDEYEYPRTNETLKQIHKQQWLDYYECLKGAYTEAGRERIIYPNAFTALEGTSVTLVCRVCISPAEVHMADLIDWYFNSSSKSGVIKSIVEDTEHIIRSSDSQYIVMYNLKVEQAGVYWCEMGDTMGSIYYLHIDNNTQAIDTVYPNTAIHAPQALPAKIVPEYRLKIYNTWTTWGSCSTCDVVGVKIRYGYCTISLYETSTYDEYEASELRHVEKKVKEYERNETIVEGATENTTTVNETLRMQLRTTLSLFKNKLPCKSRLVPKQIRMLPVIKNRKTEVMRRYCKKKCRKSVIFEVRDEKGNILESANNSAGVYSMVQGMPKPSPSVIRNIIYKKHKKRIKLVCPGNLNADISIIWQVDNKVIIPSYIREQSNGRIHINPQMHIIFESLKFEDANVYSCWQNNELAGIIKLNVTGEIEFKLNYHVILIGAILIISVFLIIFWRAFKGRMRYTMH